MGHEEYHKILHVSMIPHGPLRVSVPQDSLRLIASTCGMKSTTRLTALQRSRRHKTFQCCQMIHEIPTLLPQKQIASSQPSHNMITQTPNHWAPRKSINTHCRLTVMVFQEARGILAGVNLVSKTLIWNDVLNIARTTKVLYWLFPNMEQIFTWGRGCEHSNLYYFQILPKRLNA